LASYPLFHQPTNKFFRNFNRIAALFRFEKDEQQEKTMPLLLPLLIGVPVVLVGGYWIVHSIH
jgi:hypothetical protein